MSNILIKNGKFINVVKTSKQALIAKEEESQEETKYRERFETYETKLTDEVAILIVNGKIKKIYENKEEETDPEAKDAFTHDAKGGYIMPGLIDCHVHYGGVNGASDKDWVAENDFEQAIRSVQQCHQSLRHGFTTVRDISRNGIYLRNMIDQGFIMGPRIIPCGRGLTRTGGHADSLHFPQEFVKQHHPWGSIADGPAEVRKAVRELLREGSQCIKLWASGGGLNDWEKETDTHFTEEEIKIIVDEAKLFNVPVAAHCENRDSIIKCIAAGVNSIEHGEEFDEDVKNWFENKYLREKADPNDPGKMIPGAQPDITLVPTIGLYMDWYKQYNPPKERVYPQGMKGSLKEKEIQRIKGSFAIARELGIRIAVGADSFCGSLTPYGMYTHNEMYKLKKAGMTENEIIVAATRNGALCLGIENETGTIEVGKDADILILTKNPLINIENIAHENIHSIIKQGEIVNLHNMSRIDIVDIERKKHDLEE